MPIQFSHQDKPFIRFLQYLTRESGRILLNYFKKNLEVELKADATPVTDADRRAEERLRQLIEKEFPEHGIIGEEFGEKNATSEYVWLIDPLDGTKSFVSGVPLFGTLLALLKKGKPLIGVIANPILKTFLFGDNELTLLNNRPVRTSSCQILSEAILCTTSPRSSWQLHQPQNFIRLANSVKLFRGWGDCFGYQLLACGKIDIMLDPIMNRWDSLPLIPIIRGSGGVITNWQGADPVCDPSSIVAATAGLHKEVIRILNQSQEGA